MTYERAPLPDELRKKAVAYLRDKLHYETLQEVRDLRARDPEGWSAGYHMFFGMTVRNLLRRVIKDDELPGNKWDGEHEFQNWDDYYVEVLEEAAEVDASFDR